MIKTFKLLVLALSVLVLTSCGETHDKNALRVGTISGPESQLMEVAKKVAKDKYNLNIEIVEFTDYMQPNRALIDGSIDANMFQHQPFLDRQIKDNRFHLIAVGKTFLYPMGVYSKKLKKLDHLQQHAIVAIPNDPSNEGRALLLLQKAKIIKISEAAGLYATPNNIIENQKNINFKELDAAHLVRSLDDVDIAVVNTNYAVTAGLSPKDAIYIEGYDSPYANIIVIREDEKDNPRIQQLVQAIQSQEVLQAAELIFKDQAICAWQKR